MSASRTLFIVAVAALAVGVVAAPAAEAQDPDPRPMDCEVEWTEFYSPELGYTKLPTGVKCHH